MPSIRRLRRRLPGEVCTTKEIHDAEVNVLDVRRAGTATSSLAISRDASSGMSRLAGAARCGQCCVQQNTAGQSLWHFLIGRDIQRDPPLSGPRSAVCLLRRERTFVGVAFVGTVAPKAVMSAADHFHAKVLSADVRNAVSTNGGYDAKVERISGRVQRVGRDPRRISRRSTSGTARATMTSVPAAFRCAWSPESYPAGVFPRNTRRNTK